MNKIMNEFFFPKNLPIILESFFVVFVEEVRLWSWSSDIGMESKKLEKGSSAAFLHADDDRLRQLATRHARTERGWWLGVVVVSGGGGGEKWW